MDDAQNGLLEELLDRQAIVDCMLRYTRGVDRLDEELLLSAYHEDGVDTRGGVSRSPREFVEHLWPGQPGRHSSQHCITNYTFDFDGDVAHVESYFFTVLRWKEPDHADVVTGRYVDRFERRDGGWKIASRVVISETRFATDGDAMPPVSELAARDRSDVSYRRPLEVGR